MPTPPFPLLAFCQDPATPATIDLRAVKGTWPSADNPQWSDFTECNFPGYQRKQITAWDVRAGDGSVGQLRSFLEVFGMAGAAPTNNCIGWVAVGTYQGVEYVLAKERFDAPLALDAEGKGFGVNLDLAAVVEIFS